MEEQRGHDCKDVISRVVLALDGELTSDQQQQFLQEINKCGCCLEKYEIEKSFKTFLQNKLERKPVNPDTVSHILDKIHARANS